MAGIKPVNTSSTGPVAEVRFPEATSFESVRLRDENSKELLREFTDRLRSALQMENVVVLCGSGTSMGIPEGPSMRDLWNAATSGQPHLTEVKESTGYDPAPNEENIEEFLSRCDAVLQLRDDPTVKEFRDSAVAIILERCRKVGKDVATHKGFLRKLARRRTRDCRLKLFTTNYDLCFEKAAGELGIVPLDGFSFGQPRRFDPRYFAYDLVQRSSNDEVSFVPGVFQYFKLHGSVDWATRQGNIEIDPTATAENACLIYPARTKYQKSYEQPHLELTAQFLSTLRQPQTCLLVLGFGFNDDHLSGPILAALDSNPHFRLVVATLNAKRDLTEGIHPIWKRLDQLSGSTDAMFIDSTFEDFVHFVPNLQALTPAERLVRDLQTIQKAS